jgi:hypothetical protein
MTDVDTERIQGVEGETPLEQSHEKTPEEIQYEHEKTAFSTHIETSEEQVPSNFENAGAWFDSLKEAQKNYTQGQQELSQLKTQIEEQVASPQTEEPSEPHLTNELRIPTQDIEHEEESSESYGVDEATYDGWAMEFAANGDFTDETRNEIKQRTGFTDRMLEDYVGAQKAKLRESYSNAAKTVGGKDRLDKVFRWASSTLSPEDMQEVNMGLSSSSYEITLRGLASMYDNAVTSAKSKEPAPNPNLTQVAASQTGTLPYKNRREFTAERNDPKFQFEPQYRDMVQNRMAITDWNTLPA